MRITLELDDRLMDELLARHPGVSRREVVEHAVRTHPAADAVGRIRSRVGKTEVEDVSVELRRPRR